MTIEEASVGQRRPRRNPGRAAGGDRNRRRLASRREHRSRRRRKPQPARLPASPSCIWSAAATARSSATSTRAGSTTCSPASRRRSSTSASRRTASCTSTRSCCRASRRRAAGAARARDGRQITDLLKPGQEIVVQVVKDPLKTKGARLSMDLTIAGRYMVYAPVRRGRRRLAPARRQGARAAAQGGRQARPQGRRGDHPHRRPGRQARRPRARAACTCSSSARCSQKRVEETPAPALVFQEADLSVRVVRDIFSGRLRARDRRRPQAAPPARLVLLAHRAGAGRARRAVGGGRSRCSRPSGSTRCSTRRCRAGSTCRAAAT